MLSLRIPVLLSLHCMIGLTCFGAEKLEQPQAEIHELSVRQAEQLALRHAFSLKIARQELSVASGRRREALGEILPELVGNNDLSRSQNGRRLPGTSRSSFLTLRQPLYKGGRVRARLQGAELERQRAHEAIRNTEQDLRLRLRVVYWSAVLSGKLSTVSREQVDLAAEQLATAKARVERQLASAVEVNRAEVELANQKASWHRDRNMVDINLSILRVLLGFSTDQILQLTDDLAASQDSDATPSARLEKAMATRASVRIAQLDHAIQKQEVRAVRSTLLPSVDLESQFGGGKETGGEWERNWSVGLSIRLPFFDGLRNRGRLQIERARQEQDALFVKEVQDRVSVEVRTAWVDLNTSRALAATLAQTTEKAMTYLNAERERQKKGSSTYLNVLNAHRSLAQTHRNHYQALHDVMVAHCRLEHAMGVIGERSTP